MKKILVILILACLWTDARGQERQFKPATRIIRGPVAESHVPKRLASNGIQPQATSSKRFAANRNMPPMGDQPGLIGGRRMPAMGTSASRRSLANRGGPVNR